MKATLLLLVLLVGQSAAADEVPALPLAAIGWLGQSKAPVAGKPSCSGVLIAPQVVMTADHCISTGGVRVSPGRITFIAGLDGSAEAARRAGADIWLSPKDGPLQAVLSHVGLPALVALDSPVAEAVPVPVADPAQPGEHVVTVGYPISAPDHPVVQRGCIITRYAPPELGLDCPAVSGFSGGAVLALRDGVWCLVGIIMARTDHDPRVSMIAVMPQHVLALVGPDD